MCEKIVRMSLVHNSLRGVYTGFGSMEENVPQCFKVFERLPTKNVDATSIKKARPIELVCGLTVTLDDSPGRFQSAKHSVISLS